MKGVHVLNINSIDSSNIKDYQIIKHDFPLLQKLKSNKKTNSQITHLIMYLFYLSHCTVLTTVHLYMYSH